VTRRALAEHVRAVEVRQEMDREPVERREPWPGLLSEVARPERPRLSLERLAERRRFLWRLDG
jgi:hypothetical protein